METTFFSPTKRQCLHTLQNANARDVDRLSDLSDDIILEIFSSLTTEETIATGVLSKRWKGLWKEMRSLRFDSKLHGEYFSDHVISALISYQHSSIQHLSIRTKDKCDPMDVGIWVAIAAAKNVSELVLRLDRLSEAIIIPDGTFCRRSTLKVLKLMGRMYFNLPLPNVSLHNLKELHLHHVKFQNTNSVSHLLKGCAGLEVLVLMIHINSGLLNTTINVPTLLKLTLGIQNCAVENFFIQTPCLEYLHIKNFEGVGCFMMDDAPRLTEARICRHDENMIENILDSIPSVQHLTLSAPMSYSAGKIYHGLKTLEIDTEEDEWSNLLTHMRIYSPNLEILKIIGGWYRFWGSKWTRPQYVPPSLAARLSTLEWKTYICDESDEKKIATFILKNACNLKKATFTVHRPSDALQLQRRNEKLDMLSNVSRASPSCQLVFKDSLDKKTYSAVEEDKDLLHFSG